MFSAKAPGCAVHKRGYIVTPRDTVGVHLGWVEGGREGGNNDALQHLSFSEILVCLVCLSTDQQQTGPISLSLNVLRVPILY